jgi:hypothetical protein
LTFSRTVAQGAAFGGQKKWMRTGRFYFALKVANAVFAAMLLKLNAY